MGYWKYIEKLPHEKNKNSIQDGFFHSGTEVSALVRESIQNSLDAQVDSEKPIRIRFSLNDGDNALLYEQSKKWFGEEVWRHYESDGNGLVDTPNRSDKCSYLVVEDFNTTGLKGDIRQNSRKAGVENPFYSFFRAEGESGKLDKLGSHGLGKIVFPMCSRIRSIFALTTRSDDQKTYLVGQSTLKFHQVGEKTFHPDGWYGEFEDKFQMPIDNQGVIDNFKNEFKLNRISESGLSIVIPWIDSEITHTEIARCIVEEYYPSIMSGIIEAEIVNNNDKVISLNSDNLLNQVDRIDGIDPSLKLKVKLTTEFYESPIVGKNENQKNLTVLACPSGKKHEWSDSLFENNAIQKILTDLEMGVAIVKIPVAIYRKEHEDRINSFFHVILKKENGSTNPVVIRDKLIITRATKYKTPGHVSMVIVKDKNLAKLLGQSETPAHTEWDQYAQNFKGRYYYGEYLLRYVSLSVKKILGILQFEDEKDDSTTLSNFFYVDRKSNNKGRKVDKLNGDNLEIPPDDIPPPRKTYFKEIPLMNGFKVTGAEGIKSMRKFTIQVGYDLVRGNPFTKWNIADFNLAEMDFEKFNVSDFKISDNNIVFNADKEDFYISVKGFDTKRDLKITTKSARVKNA